MINQIDIDPIYFILLLIIGAFGLTYYMIPKIIKVVNHKELMEHPNQRSSHVSLTPTFGGISFFMVLVFTLMLIYESNTGNLSLKIISALTILLFTGLKDDLVVISYKSKLLGQISAITVFLFSTEFYKINFHGFVGIYEFDVILGFLFVGFIMLAIINSFNLIDGIDGLSALIAIIALIFYGIIFYLLGESFYFNICAVLSGSLFAFLRFNFSLSKKIFMGDTGSLIIGFVVSILTVKFLTLNSLELNEINIIPHNTIFVIISILIFPVFDTLRVIIVRAKSKKHLLLADKNHIHHLLLDLGFSHKKSSLIISLSSILFTILFIYLAMIIENIWIISGVFVISFSLLFGTFFYLSKNKTE